MLVIIPEVAVVVTLLDGFRPHQRASSEPEERLVFPEEQLVMAISSLVAAVLAMELPVLEVLEELRLQAAAVVVVVLQGFLVEPVVPELRGFFPVGPELELPEVPVEHTAVVT